MASGQSIASRGRLGRASGRSISSFGRLERAVVERVVTEIIHLISEVRTVLNLTSKVDL